MPGWSIPSPRESPIRRTSTRTSGPSSGRGCRRNGKPLFFNTQTSGTSRYTDTLLFEHYRRMLTFDFGRSDADDSPISRRLRDGAGPSLSLTLPLFVLGLMVSVAVALFVAFFRETYV